jgi:zinc D-Ala-D-Ala dipeptidase
MAIQRRPWNDVPIHDQGEPLQPLPLQLHRIEPHPYACLGAPYGPGCCPFQLRQGVLTRLLQAQAVLQRSHPDWRLAIFDAWRPLAVQTFMVEHTVAALCQERGIAADQPSQARCQVLEDVGRFWAPPNPDPAAPPPHSTGGAVDLTLACPSSAWAAGLGEILLLDMGSPIDAIGPVSEPDHFQSLAQQCGDPSLGARYQLCHDRRVALRDAMAAAGFVQHPNEWWHFSWGDQLWAWRTDASQACYGRVDPPAAGQGD